ncbi:MAG: Bifunctional PGK [Lentisphaerae bacterium ADurb.BinA184]|nr:MAG: Bifunctional PGK [Lentisphaerae bacterium ADurb.BinA184]
MRIKIVAGNWKMNKTPAEARQLIAALRQLLGNGPWPVEVVVCPPFTALAASAEALAGSAIGLGAQNMHAAASGAFTGEVSADMLRALGVSHVILGHSERRTLCGERDEDVNAKTKAARAPRGVDRASCLADASPGGARMQSPLQAVSPRGSVDDGRRHCQQTMQKPLLVAGNRRHHRPPKAPNPPKPGRHTVGRHTAALEATCPTADGNRCTMTGGDCRGRSGASPHRPQSSPVTANRQGGG